MKTAALHNLGCKVNAYETEAMAQMLKKAGYEIVPFDEKADVYIINTCSVTNVADRKSRQLLHRAKKKNPEAVVVAAGCYVQTSTEKIMEDLSIDIVIFNNQKKDLVSILENFFDSKYQKNENITDMDNVREYEELEIDTVTENTRAHIKIQDGCDNFCSYCIIPYARGRIRSRNFESIREEIKRLVESGFKEVVLTGINLSRYDDGNKKLIDVIEMADTVDGLERIRLGSIEPDVVTKEFVTRLSGVSKICPHFHLSMQSGCDKILKSMNRHYTSGEYYEKCLMLRECFHNPALTTDVIVGFPGETKEDYITTRDFVEKVAFARLHVFKYSKRSKTVAAQMDCQVDENVKNSRSADLIKTGAVLTESFRKNKIGDIVPVLFEEEIEIEGDKYQVGYTDDYIKTAVISGENLRGKIVDVRLQGILNSEIMLAT